MIRDKNQIYGEANDPNTVLSEAELSVNKLVVGAGNKGIKEFNPGANRIIITDSYGNASSLGYKIPNKAVGTDEDGNIVMRDLPYQYTFFKFGDNNKIVKIDATSAGITSTILEDTQGRAKARVTKSSSILTTSVFTVTFDLPLILIHDTECKICVNVSFGKTINNLLLLDNNNQQVALDVVDNGNSLGINKTITIPAGTYKRLQITESEASETYQNEELTINCLICY